MIESARPATTGEASMRFRILSVALICFAGSALAHEAPSGWQYPLGYCGRVCSATIGAMYAFSLTAMEPPLAAVCSQTSACEPWRDRTPPLPAALVRR